MVASVFVPKDDCVGKSATSDTVELSVMVGAAIGGVGSATMIVVPPIVVVLGSGPAVKVTIVGPGVKSVDIVVGVVMVHGCSAAHVCPRTSVVEAGTTVDVV